MAIEYDALLERLGGFGKYQKVQLALLMFPAIFNGILLYVPNFIIPEHDHRCRIPNEADYYDRNISFHKDYNVSTCTLQYNGTTTDCDEWVYDQSVITDTFISSFDIVCDDKVWREHFILSGLLGVFFGNIVNNICSDLFGRKITVCIDFILYACSSIPVPWIDNFTGQIALRFFNGVAAVGLYQIAFILGTELVSPKYRVAVNFIEYTLFNVGQFVLLLFAYFLRDWHRLAIACGLPLVTIVFHWFLITESPRWLITKGRTKEAVKILKKAAIMNGVNIDMDLEDIKVQKDEREPFFKSLKSLFKSCLLVRRLLVLAFSWFAVNLTYYGLGLNIGILDGDIYINFLIAAIMETLGVAICLVTLNRFGRKLMHCSSLIIGGIACLSTIFTLLYAPEDLHWLTVTLAMIGKLAITINFFVVYTYTAEVFPTVVRAVAFGVCSTTGRIGTTSSAYIGALGKYIDTEFGSALPLIIFGSVGLAAGLASLILPETTSKALPETTGDAKTLGTKEKPTIKMKKDDLSKTEIKYIDSTHM